MSVSDYSQQPDIIHLSLPTNLSIRTTGNETFPTARKQNCTVKKKRKLEQDKDRKEPVLNTVQRELRMKRGPEDRAGRR